MDLAFLVLNFPRREGFGDELVIVCFLVDDAEARAGHPDDDLGRQDLDGNGRSPEPRESPPLTSESNFDDDTAIRVSAEEDAAASDARLQSWRKADDSLLGNSDTRDHVFVIQQERIILAWPQ